MNGDKILETLKACGLPCAFIRFEEPQTTPFVILRMDQSNNIYSDLSMIEPNDTFALELYYRDPLDRFKFENFLNKDFIWNRFTTDEEIDDGVLMAAYDLI